MHFKGTLIITDPCYLVDSSNDKEIHAKKKNSTPPQLENYLSVGYPHKIESYPDARRKTFEEMTQLEKDVALNTLEIKKIILEDDTLDIKYYLPFTSETYDREYNQYIKDCEDWEAQFVTDWDKCNKGLHLEKLGIEHYIIKHTKEKDWNCDTVRFNRMGAELGKIGHFSTTRGMIVVTTLEEVRKYNPSFIIDKNVPMTVIENFDGDVEFDESVNSYQFNGRRYDFKHYYVIGNGNVNFKTKNVAI